MSWPFKWTSSLRMALDLHKFMCLIELHWITLHCIELHLIELHSIALHWIELHCIELNWIKLHCIELHCILLNWIELNWIFELNCIELHFIELNLNFVLLLPNAYVFSVVATWLSSVGCSWGFPDGNSHHLHHQDENSRHPFLPPLLLCRPPVSYTHLTLPTIYSV